MPAVKLPVYLQEPIRVVAEVKIAADAANMNPEPSVPASGVDPNLRTGPPARIRKMRREEHLELDGVRLRPPEDKRPPRFTPRGLLMVITPWFEFLKPPRGGRR